MAGRARPLEWKAPGLSVKQLARKVADIYERRHDKTVAKPPNSSGLAQSTDRSRERRPGVLSDTASTIHPDHAGSEHGFVNVAAWRSHSERDLGQQRAPPPLSAKERRYRHEQGLDRAQHSFVSISDSLPSDSSVEDAPEESSTAASQAHPDAEELRKSLETLVLRAGCSSADPHLVDSLLGMVDQARRSDAAYSEGAPSPTGKRAAAAAAAAARDQSHRKRSYSHSHTTARTGSSRPSTGQEGPPTHGQMRTSAAGHGPPGRHITARPLPPAPRAMPSSELPRAPLPQNHPGSAVPRDASAIHTAPGPSTMIPSTSASLTERETALRSLSHDPAAVLVLLQELVRHGTPSSSANPTPRRDGWSEEGSIRADSLPPYRRESTDTSAPR